MAFQHETTDNRREALKKVGAFAVPAVATFTLSEMKVHASGSIGTDVIDQAWDKFWVPEKTSWLGGTKDWWSSNKTTWYNVWYSMTH